ncbi:MAG: hypothetical protein D6771_04370, partial [Zetaproteobacteria bacterium]
MIPEYHGIKNFPEISSDGKVREPYFAEAELAEAKRTGAIMRELRYKPEFPMSYPFEKRRFLLPQELTDAQYKRVSRFIPRDWVVDPYYGISKLRVLYELAGRRLAGYMFVVSGIDSEYKQNTVSSKLICMPGIMCTHWYLYTAHGRRYMSQKPDTYEGTVWASRVMNNITPLHPDTITYMNFILGYPHRWFWIKLFMESGDEEMVDYIESLRHHGIFYGYIPEYAERYHAYDPKTVWQRDWLCSQTGTVLFKEGFLPTWRDMEHDLIFALNRYLVEFKIITGIVIITTDQHGAIRITSCDPREIELVPPEHELSYSMTLLAAANDASMFGLPFSVFYTAAEWSVFPLRVNPDLARRDYKEECLDAIFKGWFALIKWFKEAYDFNLGELVFPDIPDPELERASWHHEKFAAALACARRVFHGKPVPEEYRRIATEYAKEWFDIDDPGALIGLATITGFPHHALLPEDFNNQWP